MVAITRCRRLRARHHHTPRNWASTRNYWRDKRIARMHRTLNGLERLIDARLHPLMPVARARDRARGLLKRPPVLKRLENLLQLEAAVAVARARGPHGPPFIFR